MLFLHSCYAPSAYRSRFVLAPFWFVLVSFSLRSRSIVNSLAECNRHENQNRTLYIVTRASTSVYGGKSTLAIGLPQRIDKLREHLINFVLDFSPKLWYNGSCRMGKDV
jgi:hypothetical protein